MPSTAHDPPGAAEPTIPRERLALLNGPGHEKYALMKARLHAEPIEIIRTMKHGDHQYKSRRGKPGELVLDTDGNPVGDRMSIRRIAPALAARTGVQVTYETIRRWWELVFPDEPDEPGEPGEPEPEPEPVSTPVEVVKPKRGRKAAAAPTAAGDPHAERIRAAAAKAKGTNPAVPPAAFLPPVDQAG